MPTDPLGALASQLRADGSVVSPHVRDPAEPAHLGELVAAGPAAGADPGGYALVVESVREGYLLHYGAARVVVTDDRDLDLLAGDYLYALGLERLAALGDLRAVRHLSDLISLAAQLHAEGDAAAEPASALWLATVTAIATGDDESLEEARSLLRREAPQAPAALWRAAEDLASRAGLGGALAAAADGIDFRPSYGSELG